MKTLSIPLVLLASLLGVLPSATAEEVPPPRDLVSTVIADGRFEVLAAALNQAGLVDDLRADGPFTVFAPTDDAFAALPEGLVANLLRPERRPALERVLQAHVASGRVPSSQLLPVASVKTLDGSTVALGLRVGSANVVQADIACTNGVIHVIDAVIVPPAPTHTEKRTDVQAVIHAAIDKGVPLFNAGHVKACADVYHEAARRLVDEGGASLSALARHDLSRALTTSPNDPSKHAWALREAFDRTLVDMTFEPRMEAALPAGFPKPGPVGRVVRKTYPRYRAARADSAGQMGTFWTLFQHIKKNDVEMTAPVEMTMGEDMRMRDMAFLYETPGQGKAGTQGNVKVLDLDRVEVLSIGMRGRRSQDDLATAKQLVEARRKALGLSRAGAWRVLGYNSPMVPAAQQYWELQIPVATR